MIRGTTPTHVYSLPFDVGTISKVRIIYAQSGNVIIRKTEEDCVMDGSTITVRLTQEDTLAMSCHTPVYIQLRVLTAGGDALASKIIHALPGQLLENEVLV